MCVCCRYWCVGFISLGADGRRSGHQRSRASHSRPAEQTGSHMEPNSKSSSLTSVLTTAAIHTIQPRRIRVFVVTFLFNKYNHNFSHGLVLKPEEMVYWFMTRHCVCICMCVCSHVIWGTGNYRCILRFTVRGRRIWTVTVWPSGTPRSACRKVSDACFIESSLISSQGLFANDCRLSLTCLQVRCLETGISSQDLACLWTPTPMRRNSWRYRNQTLPARSMTLQYVSVYRT